MNKLLSKASIVKSIIKTKCSLKEGNIKLNYLKSKKFGVKYNE